MQVIDKPGLVRKRTKWVTNNAILSRTLAVGCSDELGAETLHVHLHLIKGLAKQAAKYRPKLVKAVVEALKAQMTQDGGINHISTSHCPPGAIGSLGVQINFRYKDDLLCPISHRFFGTF